MQYLCFPKFYAIIFLFFQGGLVFVCGSKEGLMQISGRRHNTDDIIATVLAVEPMKFIYRGRLVWVISLHCCDSLKLDKVKCQWKGTVQIMSLQIQHH
jgi:hypothetical protein